MQLAETRWAARCVNCQSEVGDLTAAVDGNASRSRSPKEAGGMKSNDL